jgi:lipopolysaccharide export system protein LptC
MAAARTWSPRARAALPGSGYDRFVKVARRALPIAAALLAAVCIGWPLTQAQEFSFLLAKDRVGDADDRLRVERAVYRGEDRKGQTFTITAANAVQRTSATPVVELNRISALLDTPDGPSRAVAERGRYDLERERIYVDGPVKFAEGTETRLQTRDVVVDLPTRTVASGGAVDGQVPLGRFIAGRISADVRGRVVVLDKGASLHIVQRGGR